MQVSNFLKYREKHHLIYTGFLHLFHTRKGIKKVVQASISSIFNFSSFYPLLKGSNCKCLMSVPGPCEPEDLIDGIIFAANYLGSTQLLSERNPSKNIRMMQAQEAVSRIKVRDFYGLQNTLLSFDS